LLLFAAVLQYYLGVAQKLQELGIMTDDTQLAGASAGSLIVACIKAGLPFDEIKDACFELARCAVHLEGGGGGSPLSRLLAPCSGAFTARSTAVV
jgi:hypothetical protein